MAQPVPYTSTAYGTKGDNGAIVIWPELRVNEDGVPLEMPGHIDRNVCVDGVFPAPGISQVDIEGSNGGTEWHLLNDVFGNVLSFTAPGMAQIAETPRFVRPHVVDGTGGTKITVAMNVTRRSRA